VNPDGSGKEILGEKVYASLNEVPAPVDMVDIFRNSRSRGPITDECICEQGSPLA
jgi:predicted CoA-binding protein